MEYTHTFLTNGEIDTKMNAMAAEGWRLIAVCVHPFETVNAEPKFISFWERG